MIILKINLFLAAGKNFARRLINNNSYSFEYSLRLP